MLQEFGEPLTTCFAALGVGVLSEPRISASWVAEIGVPLYCIWRHFEYYRAFRSLMNPIVELRNADRFTSFASHGGDTTAYIEGSKGDFCPLACYLAPA